MELPTTPNLIATVVSLITVTLGAFYGYRATRSGKLFDARAAAEAALMGIGPQIIGEQNRRIQSLEEQISAMWTRLGESTEREQKCQRRIGVLEQQLRGLGYEPAPAI